MAGDPAYNESSGLIRPPPPKKTVNYSYLVKVGVPIVVLLAIAGIVGGVHGSKVSSSSGSSNSGVGERSGEGSSADSGRLATATNSEFMVPLYPTTTGTATYSSPTFSPKSAVAWPEDPFQPASPDPQTVRTDRPRLIAPAYKWEALPSLIASDAYLKGWNETIFGNASAWYSLGPVAYFMDGDSGILDNARGIKARVKAFGYAYRMTKDNRWVERTWLELQNAAGNGTNEFGPVEDKWNTGHFLDAAELSAAFGIAYDWLYDAWSDEQKEQIRHTLTTYGLGPGVAAYTDPSVWTGWWRTNTTGNWNCVCNGGLTLGSLAILGDDTTGYAAQLLSLTVDNARENCARSVSSDGTWKESTNYWYFGSTGHAEMSSALLSATGSHHGLLDANADFKKTGDYHMYSTGATSLFNYGDHGPNKFSATANSLIFYASQYNLPEYSLFQRDRHDAAEPWSMFWYDPSVSGAFWNGKALDAFFDDELDQWVSMRSSWTDINALYVAMRAGKNQGYQTHNDLDVGTFVIDALGTRWAGELGSGDYRSTNYFSNDEQDSDRWKYYRKMTEGQNTILINRANQLVTAAPRIEKSESSGTVQGSSTVMEAGSDSTAYWVADMTSAYSDATSVRRGVRLLNGRKQVLIQDELTTSVAFQWRMHTNATVSLDGPTATLSLDGKTMQVSLVNPPEGASFFTQEAKRLASDITPPDPDQENPGVTVLTIGLEAGTYSLQVLFTPEWEDGTEAVVPPSVELSDWSLTSHNS